MKFFLCFILPVGWNLSICAQVQFEKVYQGNVYTDFIQCNDGGFLFFNHYTGNSLLKTNANGAPLWLTAFQCDSAVTTTAHDLVETSDHGFLGCGYFEDVFTNNNYPIIFKMDSTANFQWIRTDTSHYQPFEKVLRFGLDYFVFSAFAASQLQPIIVTKVNEQGVVAWQKDIGNGNQASNSCGGSGFDAVKLGSDKFAVLYGKRLAVFDTSGVALWDKLKNENQWMLTLNASSDE